MSIHIVYMYGYVFSLTVFLLLFFVFPHRYFGQYWFIPIYSGIIDFTKLESNYQFVKSENLDLYYIGMKYTSKVSSCENDLKNKYFKVIFAAL
jgi:hypothetical protein